MLALPLPIAKRFARRVVTKPLVLRARILILESILRRLKAGGAEPLHDWNTSRSELDEAPTRCSTITETWTVSLVRSPFQVVPSRRRRRTKDHTLDFTFQPHCISEEPRAYSVALGCFRTVLLALRYKGWRRGACQVTAPPQNFP